MAAEPHAREVTLYVQPGCGLCIEAEAMLRGLAGPLGFRLAVVNIEDDDALLRRFMMEIPVVSVGGEVIARAPIWKGPLRAALEDALR